MRLLLEVVCDVFTGVHDSDEVKLDSPSSLVNYLDILCLVIPTHNIVNTKYDSTSESHLCAVESSFPIKSITAASFEVYSFSLHVCCTMVTIETKFPPFCFSVCIVSKSNGYDVMQTNYYKFL